MLDNTAVHPESYAAAKALLGALCGFTLEDVRAGRLDGLRDKVAQRSARRRLPSSCGIGVPTLRDIVTELIEAPGATRATSCRRPCCARTCWSMEDLKPGMELMGTVRNVIDFGAFVDIGVHQDGLVHISQISDRYIKHPSEVLKVGDIVKVWVLSVDTKKKRISLTMRTSGQDAPTARAT